MDLFVRLLSSPLGSEEVLLSTPRPKCPTDWSGDGRYVLFNVVDPDTGVDIQVVPVDGERTPIEAVRSAHDEQHAQFSPDGRWIAYQSNRTGRFEIYVRPFPGPGADVPVSTSGGEQVRWHPVGTELFYIAADDALMAVSSFRVAFPSRGCSSCFPFSGFNIQPDPGMQNPRTSRRRSQFSAGNPRRADGIRLANDNGGRTMLSSSSHRRRGTRMSEERFDRLENRVDAVAAGVAELKTDVAELKTGVAGLKTGVAELKTGVAGLKTDVAGLKTGVAGLKTSTAGLETGGASLRVHVQANTAAIAELRRHMGMLHEDVIDRIRALKEDDSLRREMRAGFAELRQLLTDHTVVGDAADRRFAATLDDHEHRIRSLEGNAPSTGSAT
jgi:dipeptidyl aminopeptidase/acylaminoacyl peptidase